MAVNFATSKTVDTADFTRSSHRTVLLFDQSPNVGTGGFDSRSFPITKENFKKLFYKNNYDFNFCLNSDLENILGSKTKLSSWAKSTGEGVALTQTTYDIVTDIVNTWATETTTNISDWSSSLYINILSELLKVDDWTNLSYSNTLTLQEILTLFNQSDLQTGNRLTLSIDVDNENTSTLPVEIILNFVIA